ncbi:UDP-glucuronosyltransferase [Paenibacillus polysaccharolyticus]|uniref:UDP-glucuronosyltransferase n=1 Tax=Paenibacillus polysaccharolyticus TaxID=582692 RepID=UPI00300A0B09
MGQKITILCSGFGLGFYIPGLIIARRLQQLGLETCVEVFENVMEEDKQFKTDQNRQAYRENFAVALASQRIPGDIRQSLNFAAVESLLDQWLMERRTRFIVLSGHWVHVLDMLRERTKDEIDVDLLYVDSSLSPSWKQLLKLNPDYASFYREIPMYHPNRLEMMYRLDVDDKPSVPFEKRPTRLVIHGGGWGIGTFREKLRQLLDTEHGYDLDIVAYTEEEVVPSITPGLRYIMNDPHWRTWFRDESGMHTFPPYVVTDSGKPFVYKTPFEHHGLYGLVRQAMAVVSKPGAGALMDSLASGTPLIMLEPFGEHEKRNASIWEKNGFGIPYEVWAEQGYSKDLLAQLAHNLISRRQQIQDYPTEYMSRFIHSGKEALYADRIHNNHAKP